MASVSPFSSLIPRCRLTYGRYRWKRRKATIQRWESRNRFFVTTSDERRPYDLTGRQLDGIRVRMLQDAMKYTCSHFRARRRWHFYRGRRQARLVEKGIRIVLSELVRASWQRSYTARGETFAADEPRLWAAKEDLEPYFDLMPDGQALSPSSSPGEVPEGWLPKE